MTSEPTPDRQPALADADRAAADVRPAALAGIPDQALPPLAAFLAGVLGHLPVLGAWWCRDDWGLLARAAGAIDGPAVLPARWLSQQAYWQLTWPLFGLDPLPHAWLRLLLHGGAAALVARLGRRAGLAPPAALLAGLAFAASPLAFTPLYWAAGVQELLAAFLALLTIELWLAAGRRGRGALALAATTALGALAAKESALGLGLLLAALAWRGHGPRRQDRPVALAVTALVLAAGVGAALLALRHFAHGPGAPYEAGGALTLAANLALAARWLPQPGPLLGAGASGGAVIAGAIVLLAWAGWAAWNWRRGLPLAAVALAGTLLALAPVLPLKHHLAPYMAYLAGAGWALALGTIVPARLPPRLPRARMLVVAGLALATAWGLVGTRTVLARRNELGLPADDLVRATSLSWEARGVLGSVASLGGGSPVRQVVLLQVPAGPGALEYAQRFGERWAGRTDLFEALGGEIGASLMVPPGITARWANGLVTAPDSALVLVETGTGLRPWGRTGQAALYAALTDVGLGNFERAREHLLRAAQLGGRAIGFACDEGLLPIPLEMVAQQREAFTDWTVGLLGQGASRSEVGGLQDIYFNLLCACTGRSLDELTRGSRVLLPGDPPAAPAPRQ